jgi:tocopherol O-methyltransferase
MSGTPEWQKERVRTYFQGTNEKSYLANWSPHALAFHFGLSDESTTSLEEAHLASNAYLADRLGITKGTRVLDAGSGVGGTSIWLARERGAEVVGVTLDPRQVELANAFAKERGVSGFVSFHVMDFAATAFAEASFDVVLNLESLCHAIDAAGYLAHVRHLLRDGGRYGCLDFYAGSGAKELLDRVKAGWAMPSWQTMAEVQTALRAAGFLDVEAVDLTPRVTKSAEQMRAMARNTALVTKLQRAIDGNVDSVYDGHVDAAIACCDGLLEGGITYGYAGGRRSHRPL